VAEVSAFGVRRLAHRALGAPAEQFGQELTRLRTGEERAARVGDWVVQEVEPTPKAAEFVREFVVEDVLPRLHHVNPRNWLKPKTLLLDTVLAGARKCREEPELRDLFARLLASAMDPNASALVHPAFASIIAEMSPIDAVVLEFIWRKSGALNTTGGVPSVQVVWITHPGSHFINKYRNFIGHSPELEGLDVDTMQISISNLERLGIVETQMNLMLGNPEIYTSLTESEFCRKFSSDAQKSGYTAEFRPQILALTPIGSRLCELCIGQSRNSLDAPDQPLSEGESPDLRQEARDPLEAPDLPLFEGENPDLRQEARDTIGEWWLKEPNIRLGGRTPEDLITENRGARVRDMVRSVKYIAVS
jgi:hypothetical protein